MSLSVLQRPQGYKIATTPFQCTVTSSSGDAVFTKTNPVGQHGMVDGDYAFIISNVDNYSGFFYVDQQDVNTFKLLPYSGGTAVKYFQNDTVTVFKGLLTHGYNATHTPIVYKLSSTLWPTNTADTARTVSSIANNGGYVQLTLSGDIKATGTAQELEWVKVTGANEGIYQIIAYTSDTVFTINMPYSSAVSFSGSTVQYYYSNYHARVKIFAGLTSTHYWAGQKAYSELLTLRVMPDSSNVITININEHLKSALEILNNNMLLGTLPNDIDSFCQFYISYAECYDYSDGYTLQTLVGSYTADNGTFEGVAVNSKLEFKNTYSGAMSAYLYAIYADLAKFLTAFDSPEIFTGQWFELSYLNQYGSSMGVRTQYYTNGTLTSTLFESTPDYGIGIYHKRIQLSGNTDRIDVCLVYPYPGAYYVISETKSLTVNTACYPQQLDLQWKNAYGGKDQWRFTLGKSKGVETNETRTRSKNLLTQWPKSYGPTSDTIKSQSLRTSSTTYLVRSQDVTEEQVQDIAGVLTSPLVQIVNSNQDRRTVLVEDNSWVVVEELEKRFNVSFKVTFTDEVPAQSL